MGTINLICIILALWTLSNQPLSTTPLVNKDVVRTHVDEGDNVTMTCPFAKNLLDGSRLNFVWQRVIAPYSAFVVANGSQSFVKRYRVEFSLEDSIFNLIITNVSLEDDRKFECEVTDVGSSGIIWHYSSVELQVYRKEEPEPWSKDRFVKVFEISDHLRVSLRNETGTFHLRLVGPLPPSSYVEVKIWGNSTGWTTSRLHPPPESDCKSAHLTVPVEEAEDLRVRACINQVNETTCSYFAQVLYENGTDDSGFLLSEMDIISKPRKMHWIAFISIIGIGTLVSGLSLYGLLAFLRRFEWGKLEEEKKEESPILRQWKCDQSRLRAAFQREMRLAARKIAMQKQKDRYPLVEHDFVDLSWEETSEGKKDVQPGTISCEMGQESPFNDQEMMGQESPFDDQDKVVEQVIDMGNDDQTPLSVVDDPGIGQEEENSQEFDLVHFEGR